MGSTEYFSVPVSSKKQTSSINNEVSLVFLSTFLLFPQLQVRFREPAGYVVSPEVRDGQNCHCRHPADVTILPISSLSTVFTTTTAAPTAPAPTTTAPAPTYPPATATVAAPAPA